MEKKDLTTCTKERWLQAQNCELRAWLGSPKNCEDWNSWWFNKFKSFEYLKGRNFSTYLEVGCGPYARNTEYFCHLFPQVKEVTLSDPLLKEYIAVDHPPFNVRSVISKKNAKTIYSSLEDIDTSTQYDVVLSINVLPHVKDAHLCMDNLNKLLNKDGILIIGEDLVCEEDLDKHEDLRTDVGHPIKLNHNFFKEKLKDYNHIYNAILSREDSRAPNWYYGTLLYVGQKKA